MVAHLVEQQPLLVVILGPTGSGKTALSMALAQRFQGEIVSCDSVAVYCGLEIGAAKPSASDRARVAHHLLDVVTPAGYYTAGDYARDARAAIAGIAERNKLPIVTGGTGLYLRALLQGLFPGPQRSVTLRERLLRICQMRSPIYLHRILQRLDPLSAGRIHPNDVPKVIRAIEVCLAAAQPMSEAIAEHATAGRAALTGYRVVRIGLDPQRALLYDRINSRARAMFAQGLLEETRALLAAYGPTSAFDALGYRQAVQYLQGAITMEQAVAAASQGHRNYAKRQLTWFRREPEVCWLQGFGNEPGVRAQAESRIAAHLAEQDQTTGTAPGESAREDLSRIQ